ncbi:hypothetical protein D6D01_04314 [Aureobasidium pullulans]|uniref:Uncharacterized protein n=1 Tax=Aureobasidium pullulans TaxID=5580 RepID=A0A4S9LBZ1_AURPU|nr:hypothetical protein D6D01_04314 [Aureobasidium pullulans]
MTKGKRKTEASQSPDSRSSKRRADADDMDEQNAWEEEEDQGRVESQSMLAAINRLQHKDDGWIDKMRAEVDNDEQALNELLDDKERELADLDSQFHNDIRALLTDVLGGPAPKTKKGASAHDTSNLRPAHEHAQLLFNKSDDLIRNYKKITEVIQIAERELTTDHIQAFEKDKDDVVELLLVGQELARRQVEDVLKRRDGHDTPQSKKIKALFTDEKLDEAAVLFKVLRDERKEEDEDGEVEQVVKVDLTEGDGLFPIIHQTKKGVKKLASHLFVEDV